MTIAVMSDLHDNLVAWRLILAELKTRNITVIINCGDSCAPLTLKEMADTFSGEIYTVFGNVCDKPTEAARAKELTNVKHFGEAGEFELSKRKIFFNHYPNIATAKATTGEYDLCCYGHDHTKHAAMIGQTLLLNPGTAGGLFEYPSFALVDLNKMTHQFIEVKL